MYNKILGNLLMHLWRAGLCQRAHQQNNGRGGNIMDMFLHNFITSYAKSYI